MRNRAEKMRRDKLNSYINDLATMVPLVSKSSKKLDKTSVLRLSATHLRLEQTLICRKQEFDINMPKFRDVRLLEQFIFDERKGFLMLLTLTGKIVYVSDYVENFLGHLQTDLLGQSLFNFVRPEDGDKLRMYLSPSVDYVTTKCRKDFPLHLRRAGPRNEEPIYELVNVIGLLQRRENQSTSDASSTMNNDLWIFFIRSMIVEAPITPLLATYDEYLTRHLVDGRIINTDFRISYIAGYLKHEVSGVSAFQYMHRDDVRWVMIALRQMYDKGESKGSSCYRLLSRSGQFIYLRTTGYLEIDDTGIVESFVCINTLVTEEEGESLINQMKEKYSPLIRNSNLMMLNSRTRSAIANTVEDPRDLEEAIAHLIHKLPSPESDDEKSAASPNSIIGEPPNNPQHYHHHHQHHHILWRKTPANGGFANRTNRTETATVTSPPPIIEIPPASNGVQPSTNGVPPSVQVMNEINSTRHQRGAKRPAGSQPGKNLKKRYKPFVVDEEDNEDAEDVNTVHISRSENDPSDVCDIR